MDGIKTLRIDGEIGGWNNSADEFTTNLNGLALDKDETLKRLEANICPECVWGWMLIFVSSNTKEYKRCTICGYTKEKDNNE